MSKKSLTVAVIVFGIILFFVSSKNKTDTKIFERFQVGQRGLSKTAILSFSEVTSTGNISLREISTEAQVLLPANSSDVTIKSVRYSNGTTGYLMLGSFPWIDAATFSNTYGNQVKKMGWTLTSGGYNADALTFELETPRWKGRLVLLDLSTGTAKFGIAVASK